MHLIIFSKKASTIDASHASLPNEPVIFQYGLNSINITIEDVTDQIKALDANKAFGPDLISPRFLKEGGPAIAESLFALFNMSLHLRKVPKLWKMANVVPIHKKEGKSGINNYRPASLLSTVGKMM